MQVFGQSPVAGAADQLGALLVAISDPVTLAQRLKELQAVTAQATEDRAKANEALTAAAAAQKEATEAAAAAAQGLRDARAARDELELEKGAFAVRVSNLDVREEAFAKRQREIEAMLAKRRDELQKAEAASRSMQSALVSQKAGLDKRELALASREEKLRVALS